MNESNKPISKFKGALVKDTTKHGFRDSVSVRKLHVVTRICINFEQNKPCW